MADYTPIPCSLHDRLEELATRRQHVVITYTAATGEAIVVEDVIMDWVARAGVEYLRTSAGLEVRLDRVISAEPTGRA